MIFDRQKILANRERATLNAQNLIFFKGAAEEIIDRLKIIDKKYASILDIGCRWGILTQGLKESYINSKIISTDISAKMLENFEHEHKLVIDDEDILNSLPILAPQVTLKYFDLISFSLGLHSINDVQGFLKQIHYLLKNDGIFIGNFVGGESLKNLRFKLFEAEAKLSLPHYPHISPFIHFDHIVPLLQNAGFAEIIIDYENIKLEFASPLELMRALKDAGESSALAERNNYTLPKKLYSILSKSSEKFTDQLQLISFIASKSKNTIKLKAHDLDV